MTAQMDCVFCQKVVDGNYLKMQRGCIIFEPLNPVTPGHLLVVPVKHVIDFGAEPFISATTMEVVAHVAGIYKNYNIITSKGSAATQSVLHFHVHIVPRHDGDGLLLPWSNQTKVNIDPLPREHSVICVKHPSHTGYCYGDE